MHGREGEDRKRRWHMWPVPALGSAASASAASSPPVAHPENPASESDSLRSSCDSFQKDGRKIQVGDCALFQAGNAPPFIGIIRWFTTGKEDYLKLCVNWLYRPADVKLAKGVLDAAPNEVFYSFHKDVIPAASLLHPCKVAFLRKGVELPAGISSFVCRRVYDITNKCLWWLTDQDYINERQEEVDQLLDRTRLEMHAAVQSGGRSPKPLNGPSSTQQLKSGSVTVHNTGSSLPSQSKGKKRDRSDQGTETINREHSSKPDDVDNSSHKSENMIKAEIVKITDKGGLISTEGVEKLVNLMQIDKTEKRIDVSGRILVADVIAATDRYDCLGMFVHLKGLLILDEWLQEVHKSKTNDGSSPKEGDKLAEELLVALLRALAKLPVNLNALQTCNIGKSVNNLRSHKNLEIQKKARSLIDTWKKRVDAEMTKNYDPKSVTSSHPVWQVKTGSSDVSHSGNRRTGPTEVAVKSPSTQTASSKTPPGKPGHFSDAIVKSASVTPMSLKVGPAPVTSTAVGLKNPLCKAAATIGSTDTPPAAAKEEKSSSSSQSQNNSQTCSGDYAKTVGNSWKEDTKSSSVGSINAVKVAGSTSRHRRSTNNVLGTTTSGFEKETHLGKSGSLNRSTTMEKSSQSEMCEKPSDVFVADHGNNHRLIVKLPNPIRSPARSANGGSVEDPSVSGSRASSPGISDKHEHGNRRVKAKSEAHQSNISTERIIESLQSSDIKESFAGAGAGAGGIRSPAADERIRSAEETGKATQAVGAACSSSGNEKEVALFEPRTRSSFSSMNALIEASTPMAVDDDNGMNLLASVAAGEISKSDLISPTGSPRADSSTEAKSRLCSDDDAVKGQKTCDGDTAQGQKTSDGDAIQSHVESDGVIGADSNKQEKNVGSILSKVVPYHDGTNCPEDNATTTVTLQINKLSGDEQIEQSPVLMSSHKSEDNCPKSEWKYEEERDVPSSGVEPLEVEMRDSDAVSPVKDKQVADGQMLDHITDCIVKERLTLVVSKLVEVSHQKLDENTCSTEVSHKDASGLNVAASGSEESENFVTEESQFCIAEKEAPDVHHPKNHDESRICKHDNAGGSNLELKGNQEHNCPKLSNLDEMVRQPTTGTAIIVGDLKVDTRECSSARFANQVPRVSCTSQENEYQIKPADSRLSGAIEVVREDLASSAEASVAVTSEPDTASMLDFDLNEGFTGDDGNQGEPDVSVATVCSTAIHLPTLSPLANPIANDSPAPVTVAAPAKGAFVPPENLLWSKGEAGWKGSAATSAFRPAEPRRALEIPLSIPGTPLSEPSGKRDRPPLDIDLNEPDDRVLEDMTSHSSSKSTGPVLQRVSNLEVLPRISGGLDLDLNRVDQDTENGQLASTSHRLEVPILAVGPGLTEFPNREASMLRDFDLNNGPGLDEISSEPVSRSQSTKNTSIPFLFPVAGVRMNATELGSVSSWFPPGSSYPAIAMPSFFSNREQPYPIVPASGTQRILGPVTASGPFGGDFYRGPVLSSSPPVAFTPTAFPYAGFTYGSNFPLSAASLSGGSTAFVDSSSGVPSGFPVIPTPLVGPPGSALPNYRRPHVVGPPEGSNSGGVDNTRKWMAPGLDLNAGPGNADVEGKDDKSTLASRQLSIATSQAITEDQVRMYSVPPGVGLKRKEPEGNWDTDRSAYKQLSWQ